MTDDNKKVEVASKGGTSYTVVGGGDGSPWWVKYSMQAGFMFVLIFVLWGGYDLFKTKLPTLAEPVATLSESVAQLQNDMKEATDAQKRIANAAEKSAVAETIKADAAKQQAAAIDRWVNSQTFRVTQEGMQRVFGPPAQTQTP